MITMLVIALMLVLSLFALSGCKKDKNDAPATYSVTVNGGTGGGEYAEGATVKIKANAPETGKEFTSWTIEGVTVDDKTKAEITFTMPANAVTATANYGDVLYEFALENCTADKESAKFGEQVTFTADEVIGKRFDSWNIKGVDDLTGLDLTKSPLTFTMPANDINVAAVLEDIDYTVTVTDGTADKTIAHCGDTVSITADEITGAEFGRWEITGLDTSGLVLTNAELTFTMPASDVTATALYSYIDYKATVVGGTAQVDADAEPTSEAFATYECPVSIFATAPTGQRFVRWTSADGVVFEDETSAETTFTMPDKDVTVTAVFEYINYTVSVTGGTAYTDGEPAGSITAEYGDFINIVAEVPTGKRFVKWTSDSADVVFDSETSETTSFEMPDKDVTVTAVFEYIDYTVTVNGGTAQVNDGVASASVKAHYGEEVTITAAAPATGKEFGRWEITGLDTSGLELSNAELTFTMPASDVTATVLYSYIDYKVTVVGGTAQVDADAEPTSEAFATYECPVSIFATAPTGQRFVRWTSADGVVFEDETSAETTFTMPDKDVTVTAVFEYINYTVSVTGGTAYTDGEPAGSITAEYGDFINIVAEVPTGKRFVKWTSDSADVVFDSETSETTSFEMPDKDVTVTAVFEYIDYTVTVNGGTAQVNDGVASASVKAHYGEEVTITAAAPATGMKFTSWTLNGVTVNDKTKAELTFTMPANAVTATAVFEDIDYEVKVICDNTETKIAHYGEEVTITAKNIEGKIFVRWAFTNLDTEGLDLTRAEFSFTMPANNVTAKAIYDELITLTFEGTTAKSEALQYKDNDSKSFRLPLGSGQDLCTYTIELSNSAFTFKVYGSDGVEIEPYDNGDGFMCIDIACEDNYTIRVVNTGSAANCTLTVTQI